jgi:ESCRT-II complex subunit VPS36
MPSGLKVLHTPPFTQAAFAARISGILTLSGPKTTLEVALEEDITAGLAAEMMIAMENDGEVLRDDSGSTADGRGLGGGEVIWWMNAIRDYVWDGQILEYPAF